ncbi:MAG: hypothetical protein R3E10_14550 [Gemmatimonadota bacterium]
MQLQLALVCDDARTDEQGRLDVQGVFNDLYAPGFPAQHTMTLVVAIEWERSDQGRFTFRVDMEDPDGQPALTVEGHTDVDARTADGPPARTRLVMPLENVVFPKPGAYRFRIRVKGRTYDGPSLHLMESAPVAP